MDLIVRLNKYLVNDIVAHTCGIIDDLDKAMKTMSWKCFLHWQKANEVILNVWLY